MSGREAAREEGNVRNGRERLRVVLGMSGMERHSEEDGWKWLVETVQ
ncbi:hypothetical protein KAW64_00010 [bacterium]|nr:hypothetical protein [bacterium]